MNLNPSAPNFVRAALLAAAMCVLSSCSHVYFDPNAGAETVYLRTLDHSEEFEVEYLRPAGEGPLAYERNAWDLFWIVPLNRPDLGIWLADNIPEGAEAANVRASTWKPWYGFLLFFPTLGIIDVERVRFQADPVHYKHIPSKPEEQKAP